MLPIWSGTNLIFHSTVYNQKSNLSKSDWDTFVCGPRIDTNQCYQNSTDFSPTVHAHITFLII